MLLALLHLALAAPPNVILVVVESLRADRLSPYGFTERSSTPNLERFSKRSAVFENTVTQAGWTVPAIASLFTAVDPQAHRALQFRKGKRLEADTLSDSHTTLAETFAAAGYRTQALLKSVVIDGQRGFAQGFERYDRVDGDMAEGPSAEQLTKAASAWLQGQIGVEQPFFLYLHYMDPHSSYKPPEPWQTQYRGDYTGPVDGTHKQIQQDFVAGGKVPSKADRAALLSYYDGAVAYWDHQFGELMRFVVASGLDPNTIVVVASDHGEAFYEHGRFFHEHVYQENIRIPLIIKAPGIGAVRLSHWTQLIDVAPTLVDLAGLTPDPRWQGLSQAGAMRGEAPTLRTAYAEYAGYRAAIDTNGMKLILGDGYAKLFDLSKDPTELRDISGLRMGEVNRMKTILEARYNEGRERAGQFSGVAPVPVPADQAEALKALGYTP